MDKDVFDENGNYKKVSLLKQVDSRSGLLHGNTRATDCPAVDVEALKREALDYVINPDNLARVTENDIRIMFSGARRMFDYLDLRNLIRTIPDDMVLVPREPTQKMIDAACKTQDIYTGRGALARLGYQAMIKAYEEGK